MFFSFSTKRKIESTAPSKIGYANMLTRASYVLPNLPDERCNTRNLNTLHAW